MTYNSFSHRVLALAASPTRLVHQRLRYRVTLHGRESLPLSNNHSPVPTVASRPVCHLLIRQAVVFSTSPEIPPLQAARDHHHLPIEHLLPVREYFHLDPRRSRPNVLSGGLGGRGDFWGAPLTEALSYQCS